MRYFIKISIFIFVFIGCCTFASSVHAQIPDIEGYVLVSGTNAPVPGVWVKLTNDDGSNPNCASGAFDQSRYARTDANGKYTFIGWTQMDANERNREVGTMIDTNLDGTNDSVWFPNFSSCDKTVDHAQFSCGHDPFAVDVVKPFNWTGTFDSVPKSQNGVCMFCINNGVRVENPPTLYFHTTGGTGTPTPTRSITPTGTGTITPTPVASSCSFTSLSASKDIRVGTADFLSVGINQSGGTVDEVTFTSNNADVVSVCRSPLCSRGSGSYTDNTSTFQTGLTGFVTGRSVRLHITGRMISEGVSCTPSDIVVNVTDAGGWCQFKETDAVTNGSISCNIPSTCANAADCKNDLIIHNSGSAPGVATANGITSSGAGRISSPIPPYGWKAKTTYNGIVYNYDYFERKAQSLVLSELSFPGIDSVSDLTQGSLQEGYYWVRYQGGASLEILQDINIGNNKVVLFVNNADLVIKGKISVNKGKGLFMTIVDGNIVVDPRVGGEQESTPLADLEGIYFTNKQFKTGTASSADDSQLHVRGAIVAFDKIVMQRILNNNSKTPAELFEFGPDQLLLFPPRLGDQSFNWKEIAP